MRPLLVAAMVLLVTGCLTPAPSATTPDLDATLSPVLYDSVIAEALPFVTEDGTTLDAWVYRPDTTDPVPIIINYSPYWSNLAPPTAEGGDAFSLYLIEYFVPRGYAVALASVRGTGLSEGCFTIGGPQEVDDVDKMSTFLAEQSWSNGNVGATAKSYDGTVAQMLLTRENLHVKTIVPVAPISEWYKYNYFGGVPYTSGGLNFNTYYVEQVSLQQSADPNSPTWEKTPTRFCQETIDVQTNQYQSVLTGDYTPYWQARNYTAMLPDEISASVFYVHGLIDWNVKPDHMLPWIEELRARDVTIKMWLGQWEHDYPHRDDWNQTLLAWFDSELKGIDNGIKLQPLVQVQDNEGIWRDEADWPPTRATLTSFYPSADGALGAEPGTGTSMYTDGPGGVFGTLPTPGGVVAFSTEPFASAMRLAGAPSYTTTVSATGARATIAATLLLDGEIIDQGFLDLLHRNGLEASEPLVPGESYQVTVQFFPQDIVIPAGSVLTLEIAGTSPLEAPVGITPFSAGGAVTLAHGEASVLVLPLIAGDDVAIESPQPEDLGCWTC